MNIVFWSPLSGHGATTSNLTCLAIMSSLMYNFRTVSFQSAFSNNYLDQTFLGNKRHRQLAVHEEFADYGGKGIDGVINSVEMKSYLRENINDYAVEVVKNLNYYIPSTNRSNEQVFNSRLSQSLPEILKTCGENFDITFIDHHGRDDVVSKEIFKVADLCVINLNQNPELINFAREKLKDMDVPCAKMYVIGRYDESNKYTVRTISKEFGIRGDDLGVVPYNSEFMDAVLSGNTKEFLRSNMHCTRKSFNYEFMQETKDLTCKLLTKAGLLNV